MPKENVENIIENLRKAADTLDKVEDKTNEKEVTNALRSAKFSVCCNACQAVSSICVPDNNPQKCQGGCTVTSFAF